MNHTHPTRTARLWLPVIFTLTVALAAGCHKADPASSPAAPSPATQQQGAIQAQQYQINHSSLPPDQKQRLLNQLQASGGRK